MTGIGEGVNQQQSNPHYHPPPPSPFLPPVLIRTRNPNYTEITVEKMCVGNWRWDSVLPRDKEAHTGHY